MVETRSAVKEQEGRRAVVSAGKLPPEFFYELLTASVGWTYGELVRFKRVCKAWKETIETSPRLDAVLFREKPSARNRDATLDREVHPLLKRIDNLMVASLAQVTIQSGRGPQLALELAAAMNEQALSPPANVVDNFLDRIAPTRVERPDGVLVRDFLQHAVDVLAGAEGCTCGKHPKGVSRRESYLHDDARVSGFRVDHEDVYGGWVDTKGIVVLLPNWK